MKTITKKEVATWTNEKLTRELHSRLTDLNSNRNYYSKTRQHIIDYLERELIVMTYSK